jgi:hypothetical protein
MTAAGIYTFSIVSFASAAFMATVTQLLTNSP